MPPTQHSNSTAHKESDGLQPNGLYKLGEYNFRLERSSVPGSSNDQITAVCMQGGKNARKSIQVPSSTKLESWYVEANGDTATVYANVISQDQDVPTGGVIKPIPSASVGSIQYYVGDKLRTYAEYTAPHLTMVIERRTDVSSAAYRVTVIAASEESGAVLTENSISFPINSQYTANDKTVYYYSKSINLGNNVIASPHAEGDSPNIPGVAWNIVYSGGSGEQQTLLIGRFAIDLEDAGGDGPGSDWDDPGDWNEDWEEGDPTQTLHVEVIGALSGRHNDPIEDPSYSYIPSDKDTVKDYGCGGDGGHGGGGGAGASTVVVHKFATNQADGKEIVAFARRHGYGSGGGKGGKGGDGCILVYY